MVIQREPERNAERLLRQWLDGAIGSVKRLRPGQDADLVIETRGGTLVIEVKKTRTSGLLPGVIHQVQSYAAKFRRAVPVVVVPFMTDLGKKLCADAGVSWFDLSGNADIRAPGI